MRRLLILLTAICLTSCAVTHYQPTQRDSTATVKVDSVLVRDSVYIDRIRVVREKADTVYITEYKTQYKYQYRDRVKIDTCYLEKEVTNTVEVERKLTWWQTFRLKAFWWLAAIVAAVVAIRIIRLAKPF